MVTIERITLYNDKNDIRNDKIISLLHERYLCKVDLMHRKDGYLYASVWCMNAEDEHKMQELVTKYFNEILEKL
jgi:hypothetical protein